MTGPHARPPVPAWWRLLTLPVLAAAATGIGTYAAGAPLPRAVAVAAVLGVTTWLVLRGLLADPDRWPETPVAERDPGTIAHDWEIAGLDTALSRPEFRAQRVMERLAALTEAVLARRGLALGDPQARELLGARTVAALTDPELSLRRGELAAIIDRVTTLAATPAEGVRPLPVTPGLLPRSRRARTPTRRPPRSSDPSTSATPASPHGTGADR